MPRTLERFLLVFFAGSTVVLGVIVLRTNVADADRTVEPAAVPAAAPNAIEAPPQVTVVAQRADTPAAEEATPRDFSDRRGRGGGGPGWNRIADNPEALRLVALQQRAELDQRYADLFRVLRLPSERRTALQNLLTERLSLRRDVAAAARSQGISPRDQPETFRALLSEAEAAWQRDLQGVLNPSEFEQWQAYEATTAQRALLQQLNTRLSYAGTVLSPSQQTGLLNLLPAAGDSDAPSGWIGLGRTTAAPVSDEVLQQARTLLSADQLNALAELQAEQQAGAKLREVLRRDNERTSGTAPRP